MKKTFSILLIGIALVCSSFTTDGELSLEQYPNPITEKLVLHSEFAFEAGIDLKIFDSTGKMVVHRTLEEGEKSIDVAKLRNGVYYGIFKNEHFTKRFRFTKR